MAFELLSRQSHADTASGDGGFVQHTSVELAVDSAARAQGIVTDNTAGFEIHHVVEAGRCHSSQ